jgi:uncharacterized membrane protein
MTASLISGFSISRNFWPYFVGAATLALGLALLEKPSIKQAEGLDKLLPFGPTFFALSMAIFGADHLIAARFIAPMVPWWIPFHLFWAYFVGFALIASALSFVTRIQTRLAAALLCGMIFSFVLSIHIPSLFATPFDKTRITVALRDLTLSVCAGAYAASLPGRFGNATSHSPGAPGRPARIFIWTAREIFAITMGIFGIDQLINPAVAPGIPQEGPNFVMMLPHWVPAHALFAWISGLVFILCALGVTTHKWARPAATSLAAFVLVVIALFYLPLTIAKPGDVANALNYLSIHFSLAGAALMLASALPAESPEPASDARPAHSTIPAHELSTSLE